MKLVFAVTSALSPGLNGRRVEVLPFMVEPETALSSVVAVPPGRVITATPDGRIGVPESVWTLDQILQLPRGPASASGRQPPPGPAVHRALEGAVRRHLVSDARLGVR